MQIDNTVLDQITDNILGVVSKVGTTHKEFARKLREVVQEGAEHFDLVMREEFEAVKELLSNTRIKVEVLEKRVTELEASIARHTELAKQDPRQEELSK